MIKTLNHKRFFGIVFIDFILLATLFTVGAYWIAAHPQPINGNG